MLRAENEQFSCNGRLSIPAEFQKHILNHVYKDYLSSIRLSHVNRHFRNTIQLGKVDVKSKILFATSAQSWQKHSLSGYTCFSCYSVKDKQRFTDNKIKKNKDKKGSHKYNCYCLECACFRNSYQLNQAITINSKAHMLCRC